MENNLIFELRNKKVMLVKDLASILKVETRTINQTIKRNLNKFPNEIYFQMNDSEFMNWRSQIVISNNEKKGLRYKPFVITKIGILELAKLIKIDSIDIKNLVKNFDNIESNNSFGNLVKAQELREENIILMIYEIRGKQVMLDTDLAFLYQCKNGTKEINQAVKNNIEKFPERFSWVLTDEDLLNLRSKILTSSCNNYGGRRYRIRVFTEEGIVMLATILKTNIAVKASIAIMDTFVAMRKYISNDLIEQRYVNKQVFKNTEDIRLLQDYLTKFEEKRKTNEIYFNGQIYDAYSKIVDLMNEAKKELIIIDRYADKKVLDMISKIKAKVILIVKNKPLLSEIDIDNYYKQYDNLTIKYNDDFHDRYLIIDKKKVYHLGASINHAGSKTFSINTILDQDVILFLINKVGKC